MVCHSYDRYPLWCIRGGQCTLVIAKWMCYLMLFHFVQGTNLSPEGILVVNRGINVPFGRSTFIDPDRDLTISVRQGDRCKVTVLANDPLSQRPGRLMPTTFPCDFGKNQVQYNHFGSRVPSEDRIRLLIRYDSTTDTQIIPFTINVKVTFVQLQILTKNMPLVVHNLLGISTPIERRNTQFSYDSENQVCKVTVLSNPNTPPRYGYVLNNTAELLMVDCDEFLQLGVRYQHSAKTNSPNRDYIPMVVEVTDRDGSLMTEEYFQKAVMIREGIENNPPRASSGAFLVMELTNGNAIDQFVMTAIPSHVLAAEDVETPAEQLIFNITQPLGPGEGYIVSTDDRNQPLRSFYQKDVQDLKIAYKPPSSDSNIPRTFTVEFQVIDAEGLKSDPFTLLIMVNPMNTMAPVVTTNTGIQLFEGQSRRLRSSQNLEISDEDNLDNVKVFVVDGVRHGKLILPPGREYFTADDLNKGSVTYRHDGTDTYHDNIIFRMNDGEHHVEFLFPITIYPVDDEAPILNVNTGLDTRKGMVEEINPFILSATDVDSDDSMIMFILEPPYSNEGIILMRQFQIPPDHQNWQFINGAYEKGVSKFTQQDIIDGKIFYKHIGTHHTNFVMDRIHFRLADSAEPPNESMNHVFLIKVQPVDDRPPYLYPNIVLEMEVEEFQTTAFKRKFLRYTDDETDDRQITYKITRPPFDTDTNTPLGPGRIVYCENNVEVSNFIQAEIIHHKICYKPPNSELGITPRILQFYFSVEDVSGNVLPDQQFTILLKPINNQPPVVRNTGAKAYENGMLVLTRRMLNVHDPDSKESDIIFIVTETPTFGELHKGEQPMVVGDTFTKQHIASGHIVYVNTGQEMDMDTFSVDVSDGIHKVPTTFRIMIKSIDDEPPVMVGMKPGLLEIDLEVYESQTVTIPENKLKATDPDTDDMVLTFMIERQPNEGGIYVRGRRTDHFSQEDVIRGEVVYHHQGGDVGITGRNDSFTLVLTDMSRNFMVGGNEINRILVNINILPVDNIPPRIILGAPFEVAESGKEAILPRHLDAVDDDSYDENLQCVITLQPSYGYIENTAPLPGSEKSRVGFPIAAFYITDIRMGFINYVQSVHEGFEHRRDIFRIKCTDGINMHPEEMFNVKIYPSNDEAPKVYIREFVVMEGMELRIDTPILKATDSDVPPDVLQFIITKQPRHGQILQQRNVAGTFPVSNFTMLDISRSSTIMYKHDDTETTHDSFEFILTDGKHNVTKAIPIMIIPVDDETPRLTINNGLQVKSVGEKTLITNMELRAQDLDSPDPNITFIIRRIPRHGYMLKMEGNQVSNLSSGMNFTQFDIDNRRIYYVHTGLEGRRDLIKFDVTDGLNPLIDRYFYVTIAGIDSIYPEVINRGVKLPEGGTVVLTTDILSGTDLNTPDENLRFIITKAPEHGYLTSTDLPGVPITTFTQLDLAGNKIRYRHTSESEMKMDRFEFEVTDGFNPVSRTFRIAITDVDNKRPVLMFSTLHVKEGGNKLITPFELKALDRDTPDDKLTFTVTQVPLHGNILRNFSRIVDIFTNLDLEENLISYQHDGTDTLKDSFSFTITDGTHNEFYILSDTNTPTRQPQMMPIEIIPVDNGIPQISVNRGVTSLSVLPSRGLGVKITNKILRTDDRDSPVDTLKYILTSPPKSGYIINSDHGNQSINTWTQGDIDAMKIFYILIPHINATNDDFFFKITDKGGNELANQPFHLNWCWISFSSDQYFVNETDELLEVKLLRRGYLGETSFITITATDRTARIGQDTRARYAQQVQFNQGQTEKTWRIHINDDDKFEDHETFNLRLTDPVSAVLEYPDVAMVTILDSEDESVVNIPETEYRVAENIGEVLIPVERSGDLSRDLEVICATTNGTAVGTKPGTVTSGSDYITRPDDHRSIIRFDVQESKKYCRVMIMDDSLYEEEETFKVYLMEPVMNGRLGENQESTIFIEPDSDDEPLFSFDHGHYEVDESGKQIEVLVWRQGDDLSKPSSITVRSRRTNPQSAEAGLDYIAVNTILDFGPGVTMNTIVIRILDDLGRPQLEGAETFQIILRDPTSAGLGSPNIAVITINDSLSDIPSMEFKDDTYEVFESEGKVTATIIRHGDITHESTVRCYTRQASAQVMMDYNERPDTDASIVTFKPGEREKPCIVELVDDNLYEETEEFRLVLGSPRSSTAGNAKIGNRNYTIIKLKDKADKPIIKFSSAHYTVNEPLFEGDMTILTVPVIRQGDLSQRSEVTVHSKDGSARAGDDYNGFSKVLVFSEGVSQHNIEIQILYDDIKEFREVFTIHLSQDRLMIADVTRQNSKAIVSIEENSKMADVVFPSPPLVVSLRDYDNAAIDNTITDNPVNGYPLICITPCNPKHPDYSKTADICDSEGINNTLTKFRWKVAAPSDSTGVTKPLADLQSTAFFSSTRRITLDSVYFNSGSRVQCLARAVNLEGDPGREQASNVVIVSREHGLCPARKSDVVGSEPFTAKLRYLGPSDANHPNQVRITVTFPHRDGMLPVVSTYRPSNFDFILSPNALRVAQHQCSNLLDISEVQRSRGFISNRTRNLNSFGEMESYQYSSKLRSERTLRFYSNLNLESCLWEFNGYFNMSELVSVCGGRIGADGQAFNLKQSYLTMRIPLYVSYVFHSPAGDGGWTDVNMDTDLQLTFVYDTAILWENGISSLSDSTLKGHLYPTSMRIEKNNKLVVAFKTVARFRGQFVPYHQASDLQSMVTSTDHPKLTFTLRLLRSDPTYDQPEQLWEFESDFSIQDYSGMYEIKLIPCTTSVSIEYSLPIQCNPRDPLTFDLPVRFQQISDPVASKFSLNTEFHLLKKRDLWLSDGSTGFGDDSDAAFSTGDKLYGRVNVDQVQNLGDEFGLTLEKVFLCSGKDGYIPKYDPDNQEYGCLADSKNLQYTLRILDRGAPHTVDKEFNDAKFDVKLAADDPTATKLVQQPGADGFSMNIQPLFQIDSGRMWFLHAIYTMRSSRGKRSLHASSSTIRHTRSIDDSYGIGEKGKGTNMAQIKMLDSAQRDDDDDRGMYEVSENGDKGSSLVPVLIGIAVLFIISLFILAIFIRRRRKHSSPPPSPTGTITVISGYGATKVVCVGDSKGGGQGDRTEV